MEGIIKSNVADFIFGGNSSFTISNVDSKVSYNYHVRECKDNHKMFFVSVKEGNGSYEYAGYVIRYNSCKYSYITGKKGKRSQTDPAIKGLIYATTHGDNGLNYPMQINHHGRCACCGKELTDEESIDRGFGPYCYKKVFGSAII